MGYYRFVCQNQKGEFFRGEMEAADKPDLIRRLEGQTLFMVWCLPVNASDSFTYASDLSVQKLTPISENAARKIIASQGKWSEIPPESGTLPAVSPDERVRSLFRRWLGWIRIERGLGVVIGSLIGISAGLWWIDRPPPMPPDLVVLGEKLNAIPPGTRRAAVEAIFPNRTRANPLPTMTSYIQREWVVEVVYDQEGGPGDAQNRVVSTTLKLRPPVEPAPVSAPNRVSP